MKYLISMGRLEDRTAILPGFDTGDEIIDFDGTNRRSLPRGKASIDKPTEPRAWMLGIA
jgi:hypothetical protein